jgi:hypothetical protein
MKTKQEPKKTYSVAALFNQLASPEDREQIRGILVRIGTPNAIELSGKLTMGPYIPLPTKMEQTG